MEVNKEIGTKISEGKTKCVFQSIKNDQHVIILSKDSISAGNGAKKDELSGKGKFSTTTTANVFRLLQLSSIPTHFLSQIANDMFVALKCCMIPLEVIVRRLATGSYLKRFKDLKEGTRFDPVIVEFTFKDDNLGDPLISDEEILAKNLVCGGLKIDMKVIETLKKMAEKAFLVLECGWKNLDVTLVDFKVEFGVTTEGKIILADVIDNDSWRIWPKGDKNMMKDKQVYRNLVGSLTEEDKGKLIENYAWVTERSAWLLDSVLPQSNDGPLVGVIMGSQSDWETMQYSVSVLEKLGISYETKIVSAHRTPERLYTYAKTAISRGLRVIIAGAGGAAHLPGMTASMTSLPVLGVPVQSKALNGLDSLLSIVQMPGGIPVGTLAIGTAGATNAALLAASILATSGSFPEISNALEKYRANQQESVPEVPVDTTEQESTQKISIPQAISQNKTHQFPFKMIPPGKTIGIVGGGQLAKMIAQSATQLGYKIHVYCPDKKSPAFQVCDNKTIADYSDQKNLAMFAASVEVITYEFENIPLQTLDYLSQWASVLPSKEILGICQNRLKEKTFVNSVGIPTTRFESVLNLGQLKEAIQKLGTPAILKTNTMGYDGKGQILINKEDDLETVWKTMTEKMKCTEAILEAFVDFEKEISVIVARSADGTKSTFPVGENRHSNHILSETNVPANISEITQKDAEDAALKIADGIHLVGILAVEMFVKKDGKILVNELAPRPHNSGHWTIEGTVTSQFEQLVRAVCGLPLGSTKLRTKKVIMLNLLGKEVHEWQKYLTIPNAHLHLYGKSEAMEGRKMGHVTILNDE